MTMMAHHWNRRTTSSPRPLNDPIPAATATTHLRPRRRRIASPARADLTTSTARAANDQLFGGTQNDNLYGGDGNDILHGDSGRGTVKGTDFGSDNLNGGGGNDVAVPERRQRHRDPRQRPDTLLVQVAGSDDRARRRDRQVLHQPDRLQPQPGPLRLRRRRPRRRRQRRQLHRRRQRHRGGQAASFFKGAAAASNGESVMVLTDQAFATGADAVSPRRTRRWATS